MLSFTKIRGLLAQPSSRTAFLRHKDKTPIGQESLRLLAHHHLVSTEFPTLKAWHIKARGRAAHPGYAESPRSCGLPVLRRTPTGFHNLAPPVRVGRHATRARATPLGLQGRLTALCGAMFIAMPSAARAQAPILGQPYQVPFEFSGYGAGTLINYGGYNYVVQ